MSSILNRLGYPAGQTVDRSDVVPIVDMATGTETYVTVGELLDGIGAVTSQTNPLTGKAEITAGGEIVEIGGGGVGARKSTTGVLKRYGSQAQVIEAYGVKNVVLKIEAPAPFKRVRVHFFQRSAYGTSNWRFAVASTDRFAVDTVANAFYPSKGEVSYNGLLDASNNVGWVIGTFGGGGIAVHGPRISNALPVGSTYSPKLYPSSDFTSTWEQSPTNNALCDHVMSDWVEVSSVLANPLPPSGKKSHFLLLKTFCAGGGFPIEVPQAYNITGAQELVRYNGWLDGTEYLIYARPYSGGDGISDLSLMPASAGVPTGAVSAHYPYIAIEFDFDIPVRSFACVGDSNTEGYLWPMAAIEAASSDEVPYLSANFGMSSNRSIQYYNVFGNVLKSGIEFTDWLIPSHSTNDSTNTVLDTTRSASQIKQKIIEARKAGVKIWIWTHFYGVNGPVGTSGNDPEIMGYLDWIRSLASDDVKIVDTAAGWIRASMLSGDNTHPNATGIEYLKGVFLASLNADKE